MSVISREHLLEEIGKLKHSPWFKRGSSVRDDAISHMQYLERKEAVEIIEDLCIKKEPEVEVWYGMHGRTIEAPKGTFDAIYNDATEDEDDI